MGAEGLGIGGASSASAALAMLLARRAAPSSALRVAPA